MHLADDDHVLVLVAHHIACDGWSKGLLIGELGTAYDAIVAGRSPELPELPLEYADFAAWQHQRLSGRRLEELTAYWRERLAGHAPALELPADHPRSQTQAFVGAVEWLSVPGALAEQARAVGREERATPFMTLLSAFYALLYALSGQRDLLVGSPSAMRTHPELEHVVGLFANTLVYRTEIEGEPSFRALIRAVRETALGVYAHQELPFEKIVEALRPPRDASRNPLVQINMRVEGREPELTLHGLDVEAIPIDPQIARFDLAIELGETDDGYAGYLEYDRALFSPATAARHAAGYVDVLADAVAHPDVPILALASLRRVRGTSG
jgi:hypothetical protein